MPGNLQLPDSLVPEHRGPVTILRLNRPAKRNALDEATVLGLEHFFNHLPDETLVVILHGEGDHFSAGLDLSEVRDRDSTDAMFHSRMWHRAFQPIIEGKVPVVAVLRGAVIGGGLELACCAHIRVAERTAFYALPEGQRGIFVGGGGSVRVSRLIGLSRMQDMMLTGRTYGAEEGLNIGFSQYLTEAGQGLAKALQLAERIANNAPLTNYAVLHVLPHISEADPRAGLLTESLMAAVSLADEEAKKRLADFLEKRAAKVVHEG
jgi:enoyl-CoA hydratase/carnithine racemase